jgi:hypothetical protein
MGLLRGGVLGDVGGVLDSVLGVEHHTQSPRKSSFWFNSVRGTCWEILRRRRTEAHRRRRHARIGTRMFISVQLCITVPAVRIPWGYTET